MVSRSHISHWIKSLRTNVWLWSMLGTPSNLSPVLLLPWKNNIDGRRKKKTTCSISSLILHMSHANRKKAKQCHTNWYWQKEFWILCPKSDAATIKNDWHKKMYLFIELGQACWPTNRSAVWDRTRYGLVTDTLSTRMTYWTDFLMKSISQPHVVYQIKFLQHQASCFSICMVQWKSLVQTTDQLRYASRRESKLKNRSLMSLVNMLKRDRSAQYNNFCNH